MNEQSSQPEELSNAPKGDSETLALLKKMQQQLLFLEKKVDTLTNMMLSQQVESAPAAYPARPFPPKPFAKPFSKPYGKPSFDKPFRDKGRHRDRASGDSRESGSSDRSGFESKRFEKRPWEKNPGFAKKTFEKRPGEENRSFEPKRFEKRSADAPRSFEKKPFSKRPGEAKSGFPYKKKSFSGKPKPRE